jgi:hypothetical protein
MYYVVRTNKCVSQIFGQYFQILCQLYIYIYICTVLTIDCPAIGCHLSVDPGTEEACICIHSWVVGLKYYTLR